MGLLAGPVEELCAQDTTAIDLREAIDIALRQNVDLALAEQDVREAEAGRSSARLDLLPRLSISGYGTQSHGLSFDETVGELTQQRTRYAGGRLSGSLVLFDGFRRVARLEEAGRSVDAAEHGRTRARQQVIYSTIDRFLQVALDREMVQIQRENLEAQQTQLDQVERLAEAGRRPESDRLQQEERVAAARVELLRARQAVDLSRNRLVQTLNLDPLGAYRFETPGSEELDVDTSAAAVGTLLERALGRRPDLEAQQARVQAADAQLSLARSSYWPSISINGGVGSNFTSAIENVDLAEQLDRNRSGSIGLNVSIPLTDWFTTSRQAQQAQARRRSADLRATSLRQEIAAQVKEAHLSIRALEAQLRAGRTRMDAAEAALEAEEQRYRLGSSTIGDLADARAQFVEARSELARTRFQLIQQEAALAYQTGVIDASILASSTSAP